MMQESYSDQTKLIAAVEHYKCQRGWYYYSKIHYLVFNPVWAWAGENYRGTPATTPL